MQHGTSPAPTGTKRSLTPPRLEASPANTALLELLEKGRHVTHAYLQLDSRKPLLLHA